jgi:AcrR family transcriptional regulator
MSKAKQNDYHHGNLRQALLDLAETRLTDIRADDLSLRALAREIGVSQTAPYRHFGDKNALLAALATRGYIAMTTRMIRAQQGAGADPRAKLRAVGKAYIDYSMEHPELFKVMLGPSLQPQDRYPELSDASRQSFILVHEVVREGVEQGLFREDNLEYLTNAAWASVHGIATLKLDRAELFDSQVIDLERQFDTSIDIFISGISKD